MVTINTDYSTRQGVLFDISALPEINTDDWYIKSISTENGWVRADIEDDKHFSLNCSFHEDIQSIINLTIGFRANPYKEETERDMSFNWAGHWVETVVTPFNIRNNGTSDLSFKICGGQKGQMADYPFDVYYTVQPITNDPDQILNFPYNHTTNMEDLDFSIPAGYAVYLYSDVMERWGGLNYDPSGEDPFYDGGFYPVITGHSDYSFGGNIMSLLKNRVLYSSCFWRMFTACRDTLTVAPALPATELEYGCYGYMFEGCDKLVTSPALPARDLPDTCYQGMFQNCSGMTTAPSLDHIRKIGMWSCYDMFSGCGSLENIPEFRDDVALQEYACGFMFSGVNLNHPYTFPETAYAANCFLQMFSNVNVNAEVTIPSGATLAERCFAGLFTGGTINVTPKLEPTTLAPYCYYNMFYYANFQCDPPRLPAKILPEGCYSSMFHMNNNTLKNPPIIEAEIVGTSSCASMFQGCFGLQSAPDLSKIREIGSGCFGNMFLLCHDMTGNIVLNPETLKVNSYYSMLVGCRSIDSVNAKFLNVMNSNGVIEEYTAENCARYTGEWLKNVDDKIFIKNPAATWNVSGSYDSIPDTWTIVTDIA